jgi:hypothetical protein
MSNFGDSPHLVPLAAKGLAHWFLSPSCPFIDRQRPSLLGSAPFISIRTKLTIITAVSGY